MQKIIVIVFLIMINFTQNAECLPLKKDYRQKFLQNAINAEKRGSHKSVFFNYEKYFFYYPDDIAALEKYALFCEKNAYFEKAVELYSHLYILSNKSEIYLVKVKENALKTEREKNNLLEAERLRQFAAKSTNKNKIKDNNKTKVAQNNRLKSKKQSKPVIKYEFSDEYKMYRALEQKKFETAKSYLVLLLKSNPKNKAYIKLMSDISLSLNDYKTASIYLEKQTLNFEQKKLLAFCYYKLEEFDKLFSFMDKLIDNNSNNLDLINIAIGYSFGAKRLDMASKYIDLGLNISPTSENLLYEKANILIVQKNYISAITELKKLVSLYPKNEYFIKLGDMYLAEHNFNEAKIIFENLYKTEPDKGVAEKYLSSLLALQDFETAYKIVVKEGLEESCNGYLVLGEIMKSKGKIIQSKQYFMKALELNPDSNSAKIGLAYISIDEKNFDTSRKIFKQILDASPNFSPAQIGIVDSYFANSEDLKTLSELKKMDNTDNIKLLKAKAYYNLKLYKEANKEIAPLNNQESLNLKNEIARDRAYVFKPSYDLYLQKLSEEFKLNYNKIGIRNSKYINNFNYYVDYDILVYSSGLYPNSPSEKYNNVTNMIVGGIEGRINEKYEVASSFGAKIFQDSGAMLLTSNSLRYYFSDNLKIRLGFLRDNVEQSFLSAVGVPIDGQYTGQVANNKIYLDVDYKLPKTFYTFARGSFGGMYGQNLPTNPYWEGMVGIGKLLYYTPQSARIKKVSADIVSFNSGYRHNLLEIYDESGDLYGGYWSPLWYSANTLNMHFEGLYKKFSYGLGGFAGWQYAIRPSQSIFIWGVNAFIDYRVNNHVSCNFAYRYFNYADVQRNQFVLNFIIRGFKSVKNS